MSAPDDNEGTKRARADELQTQVMQKEKIFDNYADILTDVQQVNDSDFDLPNSSFLIGKYLPTDKVGDRYWQEFIQMPGGPTDALGQKMMDFDRFYAWSEQKNRDQQYLSFLQLGAAFIDPKDPGSKERAFAIFPELQSVPHKRATKITKLNLMLHRILSAGFISSREEAAFIFELLKPESQIPVLPIWSEILGTNNVLKAIAASAGIGTGALEKQVNSTGYSIFNPYRYVGKADQTLDGTNNNDPQFKLKIVICKRLIPGLANATDDALIGFLEGLGQRGIPGNAETNVRKLLQQQTKERATGIQANGRLLPYTGPASAWRGIGYGVNGAALTQQGGANTGFQKW